ncbi:AraC family transcriptional regulator [Paenibacillus wenxiniae]|uniref:Helix-turn-helix domain-containing protein n=1 Tax=Paenibacillus wenxiniae TaxID=1636843 RepID=A0ABW4REH2_9BACL
MYTLSSSELQMMPIQFGFQLETKFYMEGKMTQKPDQPVLYYEFYSSAQTNHIHVVPDGCVDVLFSCDSSGQIAEVCGSVLMPRTLTFQTNMRYFGVRFLPGHGIGAIPLKDWIEQRIKLQDILPSSSESIAQISSAVHFEERVHVFEQLLLPQMLGEPLPQLVHYCLEQITNRRGCIAIHDLSQYTGYSARYVRKKFEETVGFSPKLFAQIVRFQHALHMIMKEELDLLDIVHEQGYYDHSHFVNNFKKFSHLSPQQLRTELSRLRHIRGADHVLSTSYNGRASF